MNQKSKSILRPIYAWAFIQSLIFWYAIEKLLWNSVGITADQIIILGIIAQSSQVLIEVPSSIIADRWSRRKTLITSSIFMLIAITIALIVQTFLSFAIMSLVWACYFSFQSGTVNAYIYDLLKEKGENRQYRKAISRYNTYLLLGLLISSLTAGILVSMGDFLTPYWVTLIPTVIAIGILLPMHDPAVERTEQSMGTAVHHVRSAIRTIVAKKWLCVIFIALALVAAAQFIWYEYYQLYALKQSVAPSLFGLMLALIHVGNIAGAELAHRLKSPHKILLISLSAAITSTLGLAFVSNSWAIILLLVICFFGSQASSIVFDENVQHETSSELRATTLSLMGLTSRIFFGIGAGAIILFHVTPMVIAMTTLLIFTGAFMYLPVRKRLASPI